MEVYTKMNKRRQNVESIRKKLLVKMAKKRKKEREKEIKITHQRPIIERLIQKKASKCINLIHRG